MKLWGKIKKPFLFALAILPFAIVGGWLTGMYMFSYYTEEMRQLILSQAGSYGVFLAVSTAQGAVYGLVCAFFGYILADKIGLIRPFRFQKKLLIRCGAITVLCGILFACDYFVFGTRIPELAQEYAKGISAVYFFSSLIYGGIIEEVMMRLFLMSLIAFLLWKLAARKKPPQEIPAWVFISANLISAMLFAAGHLPGTISLFGGLTPLIVFRCFLLNGALGLLFGRFYRKYGIQYAMLAHMGCHLVSKLILLAIL